MFYNISVCSLYCYCRSRPMDRVNKFQFISFHRPWCWRMNIIFVGGFLRTCSYWFLDFIRSGKGVCVCVEGLLSLEDLIYIYITRIILYLNIFLNVCVIWCSWPLEYYVYLPFFWICFYKTYDILLYKYIIIYVYLWIHLIIQADSTVIFVPH